jgi:hypothetical protein
MTKDVLGSRLSLVVLCIDQVDLMVDEMLMRLRSISFSHATLILPQIYLILIFER